MNENIDLTKILKNCPKGTKLYSTIYGTVEFDRIEKGDEYPIVFVTIQGDIFNITKDGRYCKFFDGECTLFPSKDQRDWSKFTAPWYKKEKFNPNTLQPFDKVLVKDSYEQWKCAFYSHQRKERGAIYKYATTAASYLYCIPYNEDTKHLVGTDEKAPEYYRYWEN